MEQIVLRVCPQSLHLSGDFYFILSLNEGLRRKQFLWLFFLNTQAALMAEEEEEEKKRRREPWVMRSIRVGGFVGDGWRLPYMSCMQGCKWGTGGLLDLHY